MAERLNGMPKYVVSATLGSADEWDHTTIVGYDDIAGLREREQLLTYGCGRLARDLLADGLLDLLVLSLTPVVAGAGRRVFDDPGHLFPLRLTHSTTFETGALRLFLRPGHARPKLPTNTAFMRSSAISRPHVGPALTALVVVRRGSAGWPPSGDGFTVRSCSEGGASVELSPTRWPTSSPLPSIVTARIAVP